MEKVLQKIENIVGKMFSEGLYCRHVRTRACLGNFLPNNEDLKQSKLTDLEKQQIMNKNVKLYFWIIRKTLWKKEKMLVTSIYRPFPIMFKKGFFLKIYNYSPHNPDL